MQIIFAVNLYTTDIMTSFSTDENKEELKEKED